MTQHPTFDIKPELLSNKIRNADSILLTSHHNPDGDAVGSMLALYHLLRALNKKPKMLLPNDFPSYLSWMDAADKIIIYENHPTKSDRIIESADLIFCIDYNSLNRTKSAETVMRNSKAFKVLIDHHLQPADEFDHLITKVEVSSTAELVYETIIALGNQDLINKTIAECIFVGIMTDTGSFSFSCNYPETFRIASKLIEAGVDAEKVHQDVYDTFTESRLRLLGFCLSEKLVVLKEFATAYISLGKHELEQFDYKQGDTEGVVNYALSLENIVFAALFTEKEDGVRISFRSKGDFSVNEFARKHFKGGGHKNAAGADSEFSLDESIINFVTILADYKDQLYNLANTK